MKNNEIFLFKRLREDSNFNFLFINPTNTKETEALADKINELVSKGVREHKSYFDNLITWTPKELNRKTLFLFFEAYKNGEEIKAQGKACVALVYYVLFQDFEKEKEAGSPLEFSKYIECRREDLISDNPNILFIDLWRIARPWYIYLSCYDKYYRLPARLTYQGFDKPLNFEIKHLDNSVLRGQAESGYSSNRGMQEEELWCEAFDRRAAFQLRVHIDENALNGKLLVPGTVTFNYRHPDDSENSIFSSPLLMEPADNMVFENESILRLQKGDIENELFDTDKSKNERSFFLERRRDFSVFPFSPSDVSGLRQMNKNHGRNKRYFYAPQAPELYESLKKKLTAGNWYGLNRVNSEEELSIVKYTFIPQDDKRNFKVKRFNSAENSYLRGFIDCIGTNVYLVLRGRTESRNGFLTFELKVEDDRSPKIYHAIGVSTQDSSDPLAWRELLVNFDSDDELPEIFKEFSQNRISYDDFAKNKDIGVDRKEKLYLASRDQSTLSFPKQQDNFIKQYLRQQNAFHYCGHEYFVYLPYSYDEKGHLFKLKVCIDELAQTRLELQYPDQKDPIKFKGWVSSVGNTLRISVFNSKFQYLQILCNTIAVPSSDIVLDGNVLGTDRQGKAVSSPCFMIKTSLFKGDNENPIEQKASVIEKDSNEHNEARKIVAKYLEKTFAEFKTMDNVFEEFKPIRLYKGF